MASLPRPKNARITFPVFRVDADSEIDRLAFVLKHKTRVVIPPTLFVRKTPGAPFEFDAIAECYRDTAIVLKENDVVTCEFIPMKGKVVGGESTLLKEYTLTRQDSELFASSPNGEQFMKAPEEMASSIMKATQKKEEVQSEQKDDGTPVPTPAKQAVEPAVAVSSDPSTTSSPKQGAEKPEAGKPAADEFVDNAPPAPKDDAASAALINHETPADSAQDRIDRLEQALEDWSEKLKDIPQLRNQLVALKGNFEGLKAAGQATSQRIGYLESGLADLTKKMDGKLTEINNRFKQSDDEAKGRHEQLLARFDSLGKPTETKKPEPTLAPKPTETAPTQSAKATTMDHTEKPAQASRQAKEQREWFGPVGVTLAIIAGVVVISMIFSTLWQSREQDARAHDQLALLAQQFLVRQTPPANPNVSPAPTTPADAQSPTKPKRTERKDEASMWVAPPSNATSSVAWEDVEKQRVREPKDEMQVVGTVPTVLTRKASGEQQPQAQVCNVVYVQTEEPAPLYDRWRFERIGVPTVWLGRGHDRIVVVNEGNGGGGRPPYRPYHPLGNGGQECLPYRPYHPSEGWRQPSIPQGPSQFKVPLGGEHNYDRPHYANGYAYPSSGFSYGSHRR